MWKDSSTVAKESKKLNSREGWHRSLSLGSSLGGGLGGLLLGPLLLLLHRGLLLGLLGGGSSRLLDLSQELLLAGESLLLLGGVLPSAGLSLSGELSLTCAVGLHLVDGLNKDVLVLELVTLGAEVESVVDVLVDLLGVTVLDQEASEDSLAAHPQDLDGHTGVLGTLSFTVASVSALALGLVHALAAGAGVHLNLLAHDQTILHQLANVLAC